ncbi:MAG: CsbD family protein [Marmoricola sp.]
MNDHLENKAEDLKGRAKEAAGSLAGDDQLKGEGEVDQRKAGLKDKVADVKDKVEEKIDDVL